MTACRPRIRSFIGQLLGERDDREPFSDEESLVQSGRLDSLSVVKLVSFLESEFAVDFTRVEFEPERFDSVVEIEGIVAESVAATSR